jgi:hypothetical protein
LLLGGCFLFRRSGCCILWAGSHVDQSKEFVGTAIVVLLKLKLGKVGARAVDTALYLFGRTLRRGT